MATSNGTTDRDIAVAQEQLAAAVTLEGDEQANVAEFIHSQTARLELNCHDSLDKLISS